MSDPTQDFLESGGTGMQTSGGDSTQNFLESGGMNFHSSGSIPGVSEMASLFRLPKNAQSSPTAQRWLKESGEPSIPEKYQPQGLADTAAGKLADAGHPLLATAVHTLPTALTLGMAGLGAMRSSAPYKFGNAPTGAQDVVDQAAARQSGGAAATAPNVGAASAPLQAKILATDPAKLNNDAMLNHLEADRFGVQLMKGQANRDPVQYSEEQNSTHKDITGRINAQNGQIVDALDNIRREASPTTVGNDAIDNGQTVLDSLKAYDEPVKADIQKKYQALADAGGGKIPVNGQMFADNADAALARDNNDVFLPPAIRTIIDRARGNTQGFTYNNFENMRTQLATAARSATDGNVRSAIGTVRNELEALPMDNAAAPVKALADSARTAAKARFDARDADPAYDAAVGDVENGVKKGQPSPLADRFLDKYVLGTAPKANVDLLMDKIKSDPDATGAVASHTLNAIRKGAVGANGNVLPNGFNSALDKFRPKIGSLLDPDVADDIASLAHVTTNAKVAPPGSYVNYSKSGVISNAAQGIGEGIINAKTLGMGVPVIKSMIKSNFAKEALEPGAGIER